MSLAFVQLQLWVISQIYHPSLFGSQDHPPDTLRQSGIDKADEIVIEDGDETHDAIVTESGDSQMLYKPWFEIQ